MLVLAVDDDQDDLDMLRETLLEIQPSIVYITARNGKDAIDYLKNEAIALPDVIFLDINMPLLNGKDTLLAIRDIPELNDTKIIIFSTNISPSHRTFFQDLNAACEIKPGSVAKWTDVIRKQIEL
jgi:CheY-like chemotaxis protein